MRLKLIIGDKSDSEFENVTIEEEQMQTGSGQENNIENDVQIKGRRDSRNGRFSWSVIGILAITNGRDRDSWRDSWFGTDRDFNGSHRLDRYPWKKSRDLGAFLHLKGLL